jgi:CRP-like cAMP-binding protein
MPNPLVRKLERFAELSDAEKAMLQGLCADSRIVQSGTEIIAEGAKPENVSLILEGYACRYKLSETGERQIVAFLVPGDLCDLHIFILKEMDHTIGAIGPVTLVDIPRDKLLAVFNEHVNVTRALWWSTLVDESTLREWIVNIGTRSSYERAAHLLCELCLRLETVGLASGNECEIKLRQEDISDAVGLTRAHVNTSLQTLQEQGVLRLGRGSIKVLDLARLKKAGRFSEVYLHLERGSRQ